MRKILQRVTLVALLLLVVCGFLGAMLKASSDARYFNGYWKETPLNAAVELDEQRADFRWTKVHFDGYRDIPVPTVLARPLTGDGPFPCVIFLHGIGQKKEFLEEIAKMYTDAGFAICCFDQYTRGERRIPKGNYIEDTWALRRRGAMTVVETRRLIDYLETRSDIAKDRIYLNGASFGAITGSTAAAFDTRIRATVLCYGGGNLQTLLASDAAKKEFAKNDMESMLGPVIWLGSYLFDPADPIHYVSEISPRPVLMQSGSHDSIVPFESGKMLFDAAKDPKEFVVYDSDHIGLDPAHVVKVLSDTIAWLKKQDALATHATAAVGAPEKAA
jgi:dienelactone hydrolase